MSFETFRALSVRYCRFSHILASLVYHPIEDLAMQFNQMLTQGTEMSNPPPPHTHEHLSIMVNVPHVYEIKFVLVYTLPYRAIQL